MKIGPVTIGRTEEETLRRSLRETESQVGDSLYFMKERLAELEFALEDQGWERLVTEGASEFSRDALKRICNLSRLMYLKNPLINRAVSLQAAYVWGQGINIEAKDEAVNEVVQAFLDDPANLVEFSGHQSRLLKEVDLEVLGNIFFVFFTDPKGAVKVRTIPVDEIVDIICNPEDAKEPWFYRRVWNQRTFDEGRGVESQQREAYYADWRYNAASRPATINGKDVIFDSPVYHLKVGGMSDMRFGVPETYAALDWASAYKNFLEDWSTIVRSLSRFAWKMTAPGGQSAVATAKARLATTLGVASGAETNPSPLAGSTFIASGGADMQPIKTSGATVAAEDGRRLLLMVAAATGLPETFFGDASVGTLATAKSLDRPTELKMKDRQTLWADVFTDIIEYQIEKKLGQPNGLPASLSDEQWALDINFPSVLEHDVTETVGAIVSAATLDGKTPSGTIPDELLVRLLLNALGVDDVDEVIANMDKIELVAPPEPADAQQMDRQQMTQGQEAMAQFTAAVKELRKSLKEAQA